MSMHDALAADAASRSQVWWLLSRLYLECPDAAFIGELANAVHREGNERSGSDDILSALSSSLEQDPAELAADLLPEYTRLLRGILKDYGPPPPYESLYRGDNLMGDVTVWVTQSYRDAGFEDIYPEAGPPDHIGVELRFLALLCFRESEALSSGDEAVATRYREHQCNFIERHLMAWVPALAEKLIAQSRAPFYTAVARMTLQLVELAHADLTVSLDGTQIAFEADLSHIAWG